MPKHFIHPRSREAEYTFARKNRDSRVRDAVLEHRVNKREPLLNLLKHFEEILMKNKDKHKYTNEQCYEITENYIKMMFQSLQATKSNIQKEQKILAFKKALEEYQQGLFEIPILNDEINVLSLLTWNGESSTAMAIKMQKFGRRSFNVE